MAIARFENISVNRVTNGIDSFGQQTTSTALWFQTRALIHSVRNSLNINKDERIYTDVVNVKVNYTPNTKEMVDNQNLYSIVWRNRAWRIDGAVESDDRMSVTFYCYRNDPVVPV